MFTWTQRTIHYYTVLLMTSGERATNIEASGLVPTQASVRAARDNLLGAVVIRKTPLLFMYLLNLYPTTQRPRSLTSSQMGRVSHN